jgi:hypothetical protein
MGNKGLLIEPNCVQDIFVSGLARAEDIGGGCFRFTFYVTQKSMLDNTDERAVVARIIGPIDAIREAMGMAASAIEGIAPRVSTAMGSRH